MKTKGNLWALSATLTAVAGLLTTVVVVLAFGVPKATLIGVATMAGVFVTLAAGFFIRSLPRPTVAVSTTLGSPSIDSFNLAANQYFPAAQPAPELRGFIDRQTENQRDALRTIADRLLEGDRVIVHGEGGVGKSVIAYQAAARVAAREKLDFYWISANGREGFDHGALIVDLAGYMGCEATQADVSEHLREQPSILVLDSLEMLRDPGVGVFLKGYLPQQCRLAVTTRQIDVSIQGLGVPVWLEPMDESRSLEYVRSQSADSPISRNLTEGIASVAHGIPEVMRQLVSYQRQGILQDALSDFREGSGNIAEQVFGRSFERLSVESKTALCVLSLVPNADLDFMRQTTANIHVSGAVRELGEWSLAYRDESGFSWWLSGLTRSFAETRILEVLGYWRDGATRDGARDEGAARVLVALSAWHTLFSFLSLRGHWRELIAHWEPAADAARFVGDKESLAVIVGNLATTYQNTGDVARAEKGHAEAVEIAAELGNDYNVATGLHQLGILAQTQGHIDEAQELYRRSLDIREQIGDQQGTAKSLHEMGRLAQNQGRIEEAQGLYSRSLEITERIGDQRGIAASLHEMGRLAQNQDRIEEAQDLNLRSLEILESIGDQQGIAAGLHNLGALAQHQGRPEEALDLYRRSLEITERIGDQEGIAQSLHQMGRVAQIQGNAEEAEDLYRRSMEIEERIGDQHGIAISLAQLGLLGEQQGDLAEAVQRLAEALQIFESLGSPVAEQARGLLERVRSRLSEDAPPSPDTAGEQE